MSNLNQEEMQKRGELVKRARQILIQEYTAMRNQQHQQWLRDSATTWKNKGVLIAYPPSKMYPTEQEVVDKALELYNRSNQPVTNTTNTVIETPVSTPITPTTPAIDNESPMLYQDALTPSITEQLQAAYNAPIETSNIVYEPEIKEEPIVEELIKEPIIEEPVEEIKTEESTAKHSLLRSVLSGWLSKNKDKDKPQ
jgi:hypothetical protein